jgi:hypothetical protein
MKALLKTMTDEKRLLKYVAATILFEKLNCHLHLFFGNLNCQLHLRPARVSESFHSSSPTSEKEN